MNRRGRKQQETGENLTVRNFIICALGEALVMRSFEGQGGRSLLVSAGGKRNACGFLVEKLKVKRPFGNLRCVWENGFSRNVMGAVN